MIQALNGGQDWSIALIVSDILDCAKFLELSEFYHMFRTFKWIAHDCAKKYYNLLLGEVHFDAHSYLCFGGMFYSRILFLFSFNGIFHLCQKKKKKTQWHMWGSKLC